MTEFVCKIGGRVFHTSVEVLTRVDGSFFQTALSKDWNPQSVVMEIDRDGTHFQHVLDYLRFDHLPRDASGRCNIPHESLEELRTEADYYCLPTLVAEIDGLLKYKLKGMRYFICSSKRDGIPGNSALCLKEYRTYEEALAVYKSFKNNSFFKSCKKRKASGDANETDEDDGDANGDGESAGDDDDSDNGYGDQDKEVVVREDLDEETGKVDCEVYEGMGWKLTQGTQLLCIPLTEHVAEDGALYECSVGAVPDNVEYF
jgi:hypothetical protein